MLLFRSLPRIIAGIAIFFLLPDSAPPVAEAASRSATDRAKSQMCDLVPSIASMLGPTRRKRSGSRNSFQARLQDSMNDRIIRTRIASLSPESLKHVNERCSGIMISRKTRGWTPLLMAALRLSDRQLPVFRALLRHGADVGLRVPSRSDDRSAKKMTQVDLLKQVLNNRKSGSKPQRRYEGATALQVAADKRGTAAVAGLLIEAGADVTAVTDAGATSLHFASARGDTATLELLLEHGADANARDDRGYTALHYAAAEGTDPETVMLLVDLGGADPTAATDSGKTAYDLIMQNPKLKESDAANALEVR